MSDSMQLAKSTSAKASRSSKSEVSDKKVSSKKLTAATKSGVRAKEHIDKPRTNGNGITVPSSASRSKSKNGSEILGPFESQNVVKSKSQKTDQKPDEEASKSVSLKSRDIGNYDRQDEGKGYLQKVKNLTPEAKAAWRREKSVFSR